MSKERLEYKGAFRSQILNLANNQALALIHVRFVVKASTSAFTKGVVDVCWLVEWIALTELLKDC